MPCDTVPYTELLTLAAIGPAAVLSSYF